MTKQLDLDAIGAREKAATPGPWEYDGMHNEITTPAAAGDGYWLIVSECRSTPDQEYERDKFGHQFDANFAFIAHARTDVSDLRREVQRLRGVLKHWRELAHQYFETLDERAEAAAIDDVDQLRCCNHEMGFIRGEIEKLLEVSNGTVGSRE